MDRRTLWKYGYLHLKNRISPSLVDGIRREAIEIFLTQLERHGIRPKDDSDEAFLAALISLYEKDRDCLFSCGKQAQHLISLHRLALSEALVEDVVSLGLKKPVISTRPVLYFNHQAISVEESYWKTPAHQDWRSMQGSMDSVVIWVPLMDIPKDLGALEIVEGSHLKGLESLEAKEIVNSFIKVEKYKDSDFVPVETKAGDVLIFSSFLTHRSGTNTLNRLRWSCHFRYNNLSDLSFIERGYPHAYVYKPVDALLHPELDTQAEMSKVVQRNSQERA